MARRWADVVILLLLLIVALQVAILLGYGVKR